jgi:hypothetical protein
VSAISVTLHCLTFWIVHVDPKFPQDRRIGPLNVAAFASLPGGLSMAYGIHSDEQM